MVQTIINPLERMWAMTPEEKKKAADLVSRGLNEAGRANDKEREEENKIPYFSDSTPIEHYAGAVLVERRFSRFGRPIDRRGVYLLKVDDQLVRLGSVDVPRRKIGRRAVDCSRLEKLAHGLSLMPLTVDKAKHCAQEYLIAHGYL
ncbi:MAG: hypothetical protein Q7R56_01125 [Nanoarchaeota archaeon]|nr:hypothetical protein [Nanoarchaeota archaeon]